MKKILFVCSGNVFRSLSAQEFLKKHLWESGRNGLEVSSAGTVAANTEVPEFILKQLLERGVYAYGHRPRRLEDDYLKESDLVVSMGPNHQKEIQRRGFQTHLFNEICYDLNTPVLDVGEGEGIWTPQIAQEHIRQIIMYLDNSMPKFLENFDKYLRYREAPKI